MFPQLCVSSKMHITIADLRTKYVDLGEVLDAQQLPPMAISANTFEGYINFVCEMLCANLFSVTNIFQ